MNEAADFAYGSANLAFGLGDAGRLDAVVALAAREGRIAATMLDYPNRPGTAVTAWLVAWPSDESGLMSFVRAGMEGASGEAAIAWPFHRGGICHDFEIIEIYHDADNPGIRLYEGQVGHFRLNRFRHILCRLLLPDRNRRPVAGASFRLGLSTILPACGTAPFRP